jgi:hypothetical protein
MELANLIYEIDEEIARLRQFRAFITGTTIKKRPGQPKSPTMPADMPAQKRKLSPEGRARILAAQKARWAKIGAAQENAAK